MKTTNIVVAVALTLTSLACAAAQPDAARKLPADDNVQAQTQAKVKQTKPSVHFRKHAHRRGNQEAKPAQ